MLQKNSLIKWLVILAIALGITTPSALSGKAKASRNTPTPISAKADVQDVELVALPAAEPAKPKVETKEQVKQLIVEVATQYGVDPEIPLKIANAESGFNCTAKNKTSSASGVFQFIDSTWLSTQKRMGRPQTLNNKIDCRANVESAIFLLSKGEYSHWNASANHWK